MIAATAAGLGLISPFNDGDLATVIPAWQRRRLASTPSSGICGARAQRTANGQQHLPPRSARGTGSPPLVPVRPGRSRRHPGVIESPGMAPVIGGRMRSSMSAVAGQS